MDLHYVFKEQAKDISKIKSAMSEQLRQTDRVVASQEAVGEVFREVSDRLSEDLSSGFSRMSGALQELCYISETGFREISDRLDLQNEKLAEIREILKNPLDTQAKELRARAEMAYLNNWIDEAEGDLLEAEKRNYQDFLVHMILGNIYFFYRKNYPDALKYYGKAAKYALPVSKEFASKAYLSMGMTYFETNSVRDAHQSSKEAVTINPENEDVLYTHAVFSACVGEMNEFTDCLKKSIYKDPRYLILADTDNRLSFCKRHVQELATLMREEEKSRIKALKPKLESKRQELISIGIEDLAGEIWNCEREVERLLSADNYIDCRRARESGSSTLEEMATKSEKGKEALRILDRARAIYAFLTDEGYKQANVMGLYAPDLFPVAEAFEKADTLLGSKTFTGLMDATNIVLSAMKRFYYQYREKLEGGIGALRTEVSRTEGKEYGCSAWIVALAIFGGGIYWALTPSGSFGTFVFCLLLAIASLFAVPAGLRHLRKASLEAKIAKQRNNSTVADMSEFFKQLR